MTFSARDEESAAADVEDGVGSVLPTVSSTSTSDAHHAWLLWQFQLVDATIQPLHHSAYWMNEGEHGICILNEKIKKALLHKIATACAYWIKES
jgi:hypothetical protein